MPGEGAVRNGSANGLPAASSAARKSAHSAFTSLGVRIADRADRLRQPADVVDRLLLQRRLVGLLHEDRIALDVGALAPLPRAAEPGEPVADVEDERVALLLAVVADVDAGIRPASPRWRSSRRGRRPAVRPHRPARRARGAHRAASAPSGRGRLPVWVVRIRLSLRRIRPRSLHAGSSALRRASASVARTTAVIALAPPDLLDHRGIVALAFAARHAGRQHLRR